MKEKKGNGMNFNINLVIVVAIGVVLGGIIGWSVAPKIDLLPTPSVIGIAAAVVGVFVLVIGAKYL